MKRFLKTIWAFVKRLFGKHTKPENAQDAPKPSPKPLLRFEVVKETPANPEALKVYLEGTDGDEWLAAFVCPCGCGDLIQLVLLPEQRPSWKTAKHDDGTLSLNPSVHRTIGCKSHFWVKRGKIVWADRNILPPGPHPRGKPACDS